MTKKIIINAVDHEENRIAIIQDSKLEEFHIETASKTVTKSNIYKGVITRIEPSLQAVFVDYGAERHGFLQKNDIHSDYFQDNATGDRSLKKIVRRGQEIMVQVTKDSIMKKGAMLTTFISLPGRHMVLMPGSNTNGISRKIEDEEERKRLKDIIEKLKLPEGFSLIVRTAGEGCTKTQIARDLQYLMRVWESIIKKGMQEKAPVLLYKERNLALRSIRDYFTPDTKEILIDDPAVYKEVKNFVNIISPKHSQIVKQFTEPKPIFTKYQLEEQIASIFESRVNLKSGGSIVLDQTEALVAIDVNSGKATSGENIEQTAFNTNLEAAEEIARQLRLRDLGGLIVIDFIDMRDAKHKAKILNAMKTFLKEDKARTKIGQISRFGLMEMSRQRIRASIESGSFNTCEHCQGKGLIPSTESLGLGFLRKLRLETLKTDITQVRGLVPPPVATYILNKKRSEILELETRRDILITIEGDPAMRPGESRIICN
ncbi:MAG: Rne/Rng family ribonuclease [Thermodesulfobacteriota bacterium]